MRDFDAFTQPVCFAGVANSGITMGPAVPRLPLWMCDAVGASMPDHVMRKHTFPFDGSSTIFAVPFPFGSPFGDSCLPFMLTVMVLFAAYAETANESAASRPS